jgi:hypothetical protein
MGLFFRPRRPLMRLALRAQEDPGTDRSESPSVTHPGMSPSTPAGRNATAELERLATLHSSGDLTDVEFAAAKARVLGLEPDG